MPAGARMYPGLVCLALLALASLAAPAPTAQPPGPLPGFLDDPLPPPKESPGPGILDRPLESPPPAVPDAQASPYEPSAPFVIDPGLPAGFTGPSSVEPRTVQKDGHFVPVEDRWRI